MSDRVTSGQSGPLGELTAVGVRLQHLTAGLERLPALTGALTLYDELLTDPLARLAVVSDPVGAARSQAAPAPIPEAIPAYTWPVASWPATARRTATLPPRAPGRDASAEPGLLATSRDMPTSRTAPRHPAAGGAPAPRGPLPPGPPSPTNAPAARLTRNGTTLSGLLHANLAHPPNGPGRGPAPTGLERQDQPPVDAPWPDPLSRPASAPRSPLTASLTPDGRLGWSPHGPPAADADPLSGLSLWDSGDVERPGSADPGPINPPGGQATAPQRSTATPPFRLGGEPTNPRHWLEPIQAGGQGPMPGVLPGPALTPAPINRAALSSGHADSGRLDDHAVWAEPAIPDDRDSVRHRLRSPGEVAAAGSVPSVDDVLEALADQLELALLRAYGTSGG